MKTAMCLIDDMMTDYEILWNEHSFVMKYGTIKWLLCKSSTVCNEIS